MSTQHTATPLAERDIRRLTQAVDRALPEVLDLLDDLVQIPSISSSPTHAADVERTARRLETLLTDLGLDSRVVSAGGLPSVIAHRAGPPGAPTVLLYAHHDVQPVGDPDEWTSPPFSPSRRQGRLYGRGAADDKAGVAVHLAAVLAHGEQPPVGITLLIDGEEEIGSPSLPRLLDRYGPDLQADVIVIADAVNWAVGVPSLTVSLRGLVDVVVEVRTLEHPLHSGAFGGPVPDALTCLIGTLATLHDRDGSVAVDGLSTHEPLGPTTVEYDEPGFRRDAGLLNGVRLAGRGTISERLWHRPSITVTAVDGPSVANAANVLCARARAKVSVRLAPGDDPDHAFDALTHHLATHVPLGAQLTVTRGASAHPAVLHTTPHVREAAFRALRLAWPDSEPVEVGVGGTLPLIRLFQDKFAGSAILVTGVEDPDSRAHGPDESLHLDDFRRACLAEAALLTLLGNSVETTRS